ncbi:MAG TPA: hypothetical protein VLA58_10165 [Chitinophagaceae bacterium]|nr:hypothetical protein [Chitinophagaceae bacterium]
MEWRKNLYDYEAAPPNDTWEKISRELDSDVPAIREALYDYAELPPQGVWRGIESQLDEPKLLPLYRRYRKPLVYIAAAAAVLSGVMFFSNFLRTDKKTFSPDISASVYKPLEPAPQASTISPDRPKDSNNSLKLPPVADQKYSSDAVPLKSDTRNETKTSIASIQPIRFDPDDENYIYLTAANGEVKRVSYKFEEMIPEMKKQNSELIRKWKEKLEASSFVPAGDNFFDIAEMVKILQEEKRP